MQTRKRDSWQVCGADLWHSEVETPQEPEMGWRWSNRSWLRSVNTLKVRSGSLKMVINKLRADRPTKKFVAISLGRVAFLIWAEREFKGA